LSVFYANADFGKEPFCASTGINDHCVHGYWGKVSANRTYACGKKNMTKHEHHIPNAPSTSVPKETPERNIQIRKHFQTPFLGMQIAAILSGLVGRGYICKAVL
jgi:hypothetical protein